jgi:hypothetical protein
MGTGAGKTFESFHWAVQPETARFVRGIVAELLERSGAAAELARRMRDATGTRFGDWIETIALPDSEALRRELSPRHAARCAAGRRASQGDERGRLRRGLGLAGTEHRRRAARAVPAHQGIRGLERRAVGGGALGLDGL